MGLLVIVFMVGHGYTTAPFVGLFGAFCGCIVSTRLMQFFTLKSYPQYIEKIATEPIAQEQLEIKKTIENLDQEEKKTLTSILLTFEEARRETRRRNNR